MLRFTDDKFDKNEQPTIGVDFKGELKHLYQSNKHIILSLFSKASRDRRSENLFTNMGKKSRYGNLENIKF